MTERGAGIVALLTGAWLQALLLALGALAVERFGASPATRQWLWRGVLLVPPGAAVFSWLRPSLFSLLSAGPSETPPTGYWANGAGVGANIVGPTAFTGVAFVGWVWLAFALGYSVRTLVHHVRVIVHLRSMPLLDSPAVIEDVRRLAAAAALRLPIVRSDTHSGPFAAGVGTIVLPEWAVTIPASQRRAVLAHEVWHLRRRDPLWTAVAAWSSALLLLPVGPLALRRLAAIAEDDCDGWAAEKGGGGQHLAEALLVCASTRSSSPRLVSTMAGPGESLRRVERLVRGEASAMPRTGAFATAAGGALAALACAGLPVFSIQPDGVAAVVADAPVGVRQAVSPSFSLSPSPARGVEALGAAVPRAVRPGPRLDRRRARRGEPAYRALGAFAPLAPLNAGSTATAPAPLRPLAPLAGHEAELGPLTG